MTNLLDLPGHLIRRLHQISVAAFMAEAAKAGCDLTPVQFATMMALRNNPGTDQATLAAMIDYDRVTIGGVISRLEARGYLERAVSETDRRARSLRVTQSGEAVLKAIWPAVVRTQEIILDDLSAAERKTMIKLMRRIIESSTSE